jgi:type II secretory pathway component PulC
LFGAAGAQETGGGAEGARLVGVFAPSSGKPGFAVLLLDGNQLGLALDESTPSGAKLVEIHPDHVVLERAGARQQVGLEGAAAPAQTGKSE